MVGETIFPGLLELFAFSYIENLISFYFKNLEMKDFPQ